MNVRIRSGELLVKVFKTQNPGEAPHEIRGPLVPADSLAARLQGVGRELGALTDPSCAILVCPCERCFRIERRHDVSTNRKQEEWYYHGA